MIAFGLAILLFGFFLLLGSAAVRWLSGARERTSQDLLLSPAIGIVLVVLPVFLVNRLAAIPVAVCGPPIAVTLLVLAGVAHWRRSRLLRSAAVPRGELTTELASSTSWRGPVRDYLPFLLILMASAVLTGRPMFQHGFEWLSFSNDDMANYALGADRFLRHGYQDMPPIESLIDGTEYAQTFWYLHVPMMCRSGAELMLAWVCSLTGVTSHQGFMPLILSFHVALVSSATAMIYSSPERRRAALCACVLLAASAQLTFGTVYQLIAQDVGLAVLCTNVTLLLRDFREFSRSDLLRHGLLTGITITGQMVIYPEVNPFLGLTFFIVVGVQALRRRDNIRPLLLVTAVVAIVGLIILNAYVYDVLVFMFGQKTQASRQDDPALTLFPFFLIPSGFSNFWGFVQITSMPPEPGFSITIAAGLVLLVLAAVAGVWLTFRSGEPAAALTLISAVLAVYLFQQKSGFGLYKLAMFAQAFVLPTIALAWTNLARRFDSKHVVRLVVYVSLASAALALALWLPRFPEWKTVTTLAIVAIGVAVALFYVNRLPSLAWLILLLAIPNVRLQGFYVRYSQDEGGGTFNEVVGATRTRILREFVNDLQAARTSGALTPQTHILCDPYNISLTKMLSAYTTGWVTSFPASRLTLHTMIPNSPPESTRDHYMAMARSIFERTIPLSHKEKFEFHPESPGKASAPFRVYEQGGRSTDESRPPDSPDTLLVAGTGQISLLNRRQFGDGVGNFVMRPLSQVRNHLIFTDSEMSEPYYKPGDPTYISLYQLERDPAFYVTQTMAGIGRYFLFEVVNPDDEVRLSLDITLSFKGDGQNRVPAAYAVGIERKPFEVVGRGACRLVSPPIKPQRILGRSYVGIDLGEFGTSFTVARTGLMNWYGLDVGLDRRKLVGFGRDISMIGESDYRAFAPPSLIYIWGNPESQLRHRDLEFSGLYEDGWLSEHSYLKLGQQPAEGRFVLAGFIPELGDPTFTTEPTVLVDGKPVQLYGTSNDKPFNGTLAIGDFKLYADVPPTGTGQRRKVEVRWSRFQQLLKEDTRKAAAKVNLLGFVKNEQAN